MTRWRIHSVLFLMLFCDLNGRSSSVKRQSWRDRFVPAERYFDLHDDLEPTQTVSPATRFTFLAPDLLRADSQENIYLQVDDLTNRNPIAVAISIKDFTKSITLLQDSVALNEGNGYHALKSIQLSSNGLYRDEQRNKFVYLIVNFGDLFTEERILMVSFHSGYVFIQTDKPIYNPGNTVRFRTFVSSPFFEAVDRSISIDIKNPDDVVVKQISRTRTAGSVFSEEFPLSEIANEGTWSVIAKFDHWQQNTFTSKFEVKKYVLPAFNVTLTSKKSSLSLDDTELVIEISANYLYGKPVQGTAYVVFGVKINEQMKRLPSIKKVSELDRGTATLSMEEIRAAYPDIRSLVGHSVYVKASVLTKAGSDLVEAEKRGIKIVDSPYVISFSDTPKHYKPGLPFDFTILVNYHDGTPVDGVNFKINLLDTELRASSGSIRATLNMPTDGFMQTIIVETADPGLRPDQQAKQQITVQSYTPVTGRKNYLYISTGTNSVSVGERLSLKFSVRTSDQSHRQFVKKITYMVLNKGKIIKAERLDVQSQVVTSVGFMVTSEMLPSFRVVAFYSIPWLGQEEVVSDSVWIDVADSCIGGLTVGPEGNRYSPHEPGKNLRFQIKGDPGALVTLVAVDNAVYLLNKERLTQRKIWDVVEYGDIGCTKGGGQDAKTVFTDAGLLYSSSAGFKTKTRQALECPGSARGRRSAEQMNRKAQLENHYKDKLQRRCCKDGLKEIPMPYSCTRRSLYITEGWECMLAFRYCCATYRGQVFNTEIPTTPPPMTTAPPTTNIFHPLPSFEVLSFDDMHLTYSRPETSVTRQYSSPGSRGLPVLSGNGKILEPKFHALGRAPDDGVSRVSLYEVDEDEGEYQDKNEVYLRSKFYESWMWIDVKLPQQTDSDGLASSTLNQPLPDSITEWGILAISASANKGFCVAEPYNVQATKHLFVDLKLPYSVARNEQIEIKAVIHNYAYVDLHIRVVLMKTEGICSIAFKDSYTQEVMLPAESTIVLPYSIMPLVVGKLPLEVMVVAKNLMGGDRVQKFLWVVVDGVQKTEVWNEVLDPSSQGGRQTIHVPRFVPTSVVPNSEPETFINVRGHLFADSIDNSIKKDSLASLIQMPSGCVEQNLASITLPLIATLYLDRTNSWESVGVERRAEALGYITRGYENQLVYRRSDGSYPPYRSQGPSTWITAYVVKVFSMAYSVVSIKQQQVCDPLLYLKENKLKHHEGTFIEDNPVYSTTMTGGLRGDDPEITLTAFVHIALAEAMQAGIRCNGSPVDVTDTPTTAFLTKALLTRGRRPYTVAIASYALSLLGKTFDHQPLLEAASADKSHWPDRENSLFTLEATGYALLALVKMGRMEEAKAPFKWLNSQRRRGGGFGSTQSTMVVLQALSEYMAKKPISNDLSLNVDVKITGRKDIRYHFNPRTAYAAQSSRLPADLDLEVVAEGNGQGILEVVTHYNQLHEVAESTPCKDFELSVVIEESSDKPQGDIEKFFKMTIKVRALGPRDVRMVVLDISLPTGFTPDNSDMEMLSNSVDRYVSNHQIVDNLSDRGSLILHLFKVSHKEPEIIVFRLQQNFKVGLLQPSSVTVYEYYNPDHRCSRTYLPREDREELSRICQNDVCRCTHGDCCVSKFDWENFLMKERETFACKGLLHIFQVKVLSVNQGYYDKYEMEITQVIKLGVETGVTVGQKRIFMSNSACRVKLNLRQGATYLIMGPKEDQWTTDNNGFNYMLGKDTWVERWPLSAECSKNPSLQDKCKTLNEAAKDLSTNGCRS